MISLSKRELSQAQKEYRDLFNQLLEPYGEKIPFKLSKENRAKFFAELKAKWKAIKNSKNKSISSNKERVIISKDGKSKEYTIDTAKLFVELAGGGLNQKQTAKAMEYLRKFNEDGSIKVNGFTIKKVDA